MSTAPETKPQQLWPYYILFAVSVIAIVVALASRSTGPEPGTYQQAPGPVTTAASPASTSSPHHASRPAPHASSPAAAAQHYLNGLSNQQKIQRLKDLVKAGPVATIQHVTAP